MPIGDQPQRPMGPLLHPPEPLLDQRVESAPPEEEEEARGRKPMDEDLKRISAVLRLLDDMSPPARAYILARIQYEQECAA